MRLSPGFTAYTAGNETNGNDAGGTTYTIVPKYDGVITVGVRLNGGKAFFVSEDGETLPDYNGITIANNTNTSFSFNVAAGKSYKFWCNGSKLGFFGFDYKYENSAATAISTVETNVRQQQVYNLNGQRMSKTVKGVNIVNGKKLVVK